MTPAAKQLLTLAAGIALVLLATSTFLLWRLVAEDDERPVQRTEQALSEAPPPLPESRGGGSTRALLRELDRNTEQLTRPLSQLQAEIARASLGSASLEALPPALQSLSQSTAGFGQLPAALSSLSQNTAGLRDAGRHLRRIATESRRLAKVQRTLTAMLREIRQLRSVRRGLSGLGRELRRLNGSIEEMKATLKQIEKSLEQTNRCAERPVLCQ